MTVRTRFAPSPTGYLHIGGVRTALFNWLFARQHGGQFILRIDDTDQHRNVAEALQPILDGFRWLGLDWDEGAEVGGPYGPYYQSQRLDRYREAVQQLLDKGLAYWDYATPDDMKAEREASEREKRPYLYSRRWMAHTVADRARFEAEGRTGSVRALMPREGVCELFDHVRGTVQVPWAGEQDIVIKRSDGTVTYNLANVVDDFDMKITHVIRAEEHLANTPRQIFMLEGLGYPRPEYAHLPFVAEPGSRNKLSKRKIAQYLKNPDFKKVYEHAKGIADRIKVATAPDAFNPVLVDFYKQVGYIPAAILNYLVLLGWSLNDSREDFTLAQMVESFSLDRVVHAPASFDAKRLFAFQERYMTAVPTAEKVERAIPFLVRAGLVDVPVSNADRAKVAAIVDAAGARLKVFGDILDYDDFFLSDESLKIDEAAVKKRLGNSEAKRLLMAFRDHIDRLSDFDATHLQDVIHKTIFPILQQYGRVDEQLLYQQIDQIQRDAELASYLSFQAKRLELIEMSEFLETQRIHAGDIIHALRVALTGKTVGFGLYETMGILGKLRCIERIDKMLKKINITVNLETFHNRFAQIDEAIPAALSAPKVNADIQLYKGAIKIIDSASHEVDGSGEIVLQWLPRPKVRFSCTPLFRNKGDMGQCRIVVPSERKTADGFVTNIQSSSHDDTLISGIAISPFISEVETKLAYATLYLANFHSYLGYAIRHESTSWAGRSVLNTPEWTITLDATIDMRDRLAQVNRNGGYAITHAAKIRRTNGENFSPNQLSDLCAPLQYFFSLARGFWSAPVLAKGFDAHGNPLWSDWSLRILDSWSSVNSWFPVADPAALPALFTAFMTAWSSDKLAEILQAGIRWYLSANSPGGFDRGVVNAQIALETIATNLRNDGERFTTIEPEDLPASMAGGDHIDQMLTFLQISNEIPDYMADLRGFADQLHCSSAPAAIRSLRNLIVHPNSQSRYALKQTNQFNGKTREAWTLSLWYVELLILRVIGYQGSYESRLGLKRWSGQSIPVPWATDKPK